MHETDGYSTVKILPGTPVAQAYLPVAVDRDSLPFLAVFLVCQEEFHHARIKDILIFFLKLCERRVDIVVRHLQGIHNIILVRTVKNRGRNFKSQHVRGKA